MHIFILSQRTKQCWAPDRKTCCCYWIRSNLLISCWLIEEDIACFWSGPCRFVLKNRMDNQGLWGRLYINRIKRVEWPLVPRRGCDLIWIFVRPFRELKLKTQGWVPCAWSLWWRDLSGLATVVTGTDWDEDLLLGHQKLSWFYT